MEKRDYHRIADLLITDGEVPVYKRYVRAATGAKLYDVSYNTFIKLASLSDARIDLSSNLIIYDKEKIDTYIKRIQKAQYR